MWNIQSPTWPVAKQQLPTSISTCDHSRSCVFPPQVRCMRTTWVPSSTPKWAIFHSNKMHWYILNLLESNLHASPSGVTTHTSQNLKPPLSLNSPFRAYEATPEEPYNLSRMHSKSSQQHQSYVILASLLLNLTNMHPPSLLHVS